MTPATLPSTYSVEAPTHARPQREIQPDDAFAQLLSMFEPSAELPPADADSAAEPIETAEAAEDQPADPASDGEAPAEDVEEEDEACAKPCDRSEHAASNSAPEAPEQAEGNAFAPHAVPPAGGQTLEQSIRTTLASLPQQAAARAAEVRPAAHPAALDEAGEVAPPTSDGSSLRNRPAPAGVSAEIERASLVSRPTSTLTPAAAAMAAEDAPGPVTPSQNTQTPTLAALEAGKLSASTLPGTTNATAQNAAAAAASQTPAIEGATLTPTDPSLPSTSATPSTITVAAPATARAGDAIEVAGAARAEGGPRSRAVSQIALSIEHAAGAGRDRIRLKLDPPELGRVEVRLEVAKDHGLKALILVERPETLDALQRDARQLQRALAEAGLQADAQDLSFALEDSAFASNEREQKSAPRAAASDIESDVEAAPTHPIPPPLMEAGRIDLFV